MSADTVALLTTEGGSGHIAAAYLAARFPAFVAIVESPVSRSLLLRRRISRLGLGHVAGQLAFMVLQRVQQIASQPRIAEIIREAGLDASASDKHETIRTTSVNSPECIGHLRRLQPRAVLVVGTRIIAAEVLQGLDVPFINYHAGITPKYRGVHGGYWAKAEGDDKNFGVTVHLVDEGIDTGGVLYQTRLMPTAADNFSTYPYLQLAAALPLLERAARDAMAGSLRPETVDLPSKLWSHPTLWRYIERGWRRGVW
jgi:folate-dependent phosphoribosylglycinamide formyltransferase PurN